MKLLDIVRNHPGQLLFIALSLLLWSVANYGTITELLPDDSPRSRGFALRWSATVFGRSLVAGIAVLFIGRFGAAWPIASYFRCRPCSVSTCSYVYRQIRVLPEEPIFQ